MTEDKGQVLHVDFVALAEGATEDARRRLMDEAGKLTELEQVLGVYVIEGADGSDFDVAFVFLLPSFEALEPFGTNPGYSRFLQGQVAPLIRGFAGADVRLEEGFPVVGEHAICIAIEAPEETYAWEVSAALNQWALELAPSSCAIGVAAGERQRYRGVAVAWDEHAMQAVRTDDARFGSTLVLGRSRRLS